MKKNTFLVAMLAICLAALPSFVAAQTTPQDTTSENSTSIAIGSNQDSRQSDLLGSAVTTVRDQSILHHNAGLSVVNALRGQLANFTFGASAYGPGGAIRGRSPLLVVDGVSYAYPMTQAINVSAFEFEEISLITNSNAAINYGGGGLGSVMLLKSKTGEGHDKGQFEFNTHSTYGYYRREDSIFGDGDDEKIENWQFTNALGYSKDFGIVDTRVSYSFSTSPAQKEGFNIKMRRHAIRINTGFNLSEKLKARLILDDYFNKSSYDELNGSEDLAVDPYGNSKRVTLRANLSMAYTPTTWFRLNAQAAVNRIKGDSETYSTNGGPYSTRSELYEHQQGKFANLFATFLPKISDRVTMNIFVGAQRDKYRPIRQSELTTYMNGSITNSSGTSLAGEVEVTSLLSGAGINFDNKLLIDLTYRREHTETENYDTYGATTAFIFANDNEATFSHGKLRLSASKSDLVQTTRYPYVSYDMLETEGLPSEGSNIEGGIDLNFVNNRLGLSISYFDFRRDQNFHYMYNPFPWGGGYYLVDVGKSATRGWELLATAVAVKTENVTYTTKLSWGHMKYDYENEQYQFFESSLPQWTMGILNQLDFEAFYCSFLVDFVHAEDINMLPLPEYEPVKIEGSLTRLRDLTIGYRYEPRSLKNLGISKMNFSLIGRNLWTIHPGGKDLNLEEYQNPTAYQKTVSLSATFVF